MPRPISSRTPLMDDDNDVTAAVSPLASRRPGDALAVTEPASHLSPAAKALQFQIGRVDKLKSQLAELERLTLVFLPRVSQTLGPLGKRRLQAMRGVVEWLDQRQRRSGLGPVQRQLSEALVCGMAQELADAGMADMVAMHDRNSEVTLADKREQEAQWMRRLMEERVGQRAGQGSGAVDAMDEVDGVNPSNSADNKTAQEWLRWGAQQQQAAREAKQQKREAKRQARKNKNATALQAEQVQVDASTLLRTLFRQLASHLHPDREPDPTQRAHKTALMSEVNTAYARQDVLALLHLQSEAALAHPQSAKENDAQLAAMTALVKQQVAALERERADKQAGLMQQLAVPQGHPTHAEALEGWLQQQQAALTRLCEQLEAWPGQWQDDAWFKRWLKDPQGARTLPWLESSSAAW